jgi:hypothetical protein
MIFKKLYFAAEDPATRTALEALWPKIESTLRNALGGEVEFVFMATVQGKTFGMTNDTEAVNKMYLRWEDTDDGGPPPPVARTRH